MSSKKSPKSVLAILILALAGALFGYWIGKNLHGMADLLPQDMSVVGTMLFVAMLLPAFFLSVAWHEAGHAVAGIAVGFDFRLYVVGPFLWEKEAGRWWFKWNKNINTAGGMVICLPTDARDLPRRFSVYAAGGPLASLLLALLAAVLLWYCWPPVLPPSEVASVGLAFLFFLASLSALVFLITTLPMHTSGFYSDGARILRLLRGGEQAQFDVRLLKIITGSMGGIRPKDLDIKDLEDTQALAQRLGEPFGVYLHGYLHQACLDRGALDAAEQHLQRYIAEADQIPEGIRSSVWLDAAFFYAHIRRDRDEAEACWARFVPSALSPKALILATEAALSLLRGDATAAAAQRAAANRELPRMMDRGHAAALRVRLAEMEAAPSL
jgi:hypothetical protein